MHGQLSGAAPPADPSVPVHVPPLLHRPAIATLKANARVVLLNVIVTDSKDRPVAGLKASDFTVAEDGEGQRIASFEEHRAPVVTTVPTAATPAPARAENTFSNARPAPGGPAAVVLLLDGLDTPLADQAYVRSQLTSFARQMQPGTPVAIFALDTRLRLIQGFTTDPDQVREAIKDREKILLTPVPHDLGYVVQQTRYDMLSRALKSLGQYLQQRPGPKSLIWFTGALPFWAYDDGRGFGGTIADNESLEHGFLLDTGLAGAGSLHDATDALVLGEVTIYPVDARGLRTDPAFSAANGGRLSLNSIGRFDTAQAFQHEDLDRAAEATGGRAFYNTNGLKEVVERVVDTNANFYTLSYSPTNLVWDGRQRHIRVQLASAALGGLQLQYRHAYYARTNLPSTGQEPAPAHRRSAAGAPSDPLADAMQLAAVDPAQILFEAQVTPEPDIDKLGKDQPLPTQNYLDPKYRGKPFRNLDVDFHVAASQIQLTPQPDGLRAGRVEFVGVILDDKGNMVNSMHTQIAMNLRPASFQAAEAGGMAMPLKIAVPVNGTFFLRLAIRDLQTGNIGVTEVPVGAIRPAEAKP
jgi:VWFA-related protein